MSNMYGNTDDGRPHIYTTSTNAHAYQLPATGTDKRQIGPVTTAVTGGVALSGVVCWLAEEITKREVPDNIEYYLAILFAIGAGWLVKPKAKRVAE